MLITEKRARDLKLELFEQPTIQELEDELRAWLVGRTEEVIVGLEFESDAAASSYRAYVLYTE